MQQPPASWDALMSDVDEHEYGYEICRLVGGIPPNCYITYGPSEPLVEIAPILQNKSARIVSRYGLSDRGQVMPFPWIKEPEARYKAIADTTVFAGVLRCLHDDVIVYGELKGDEPKYDSFLMLWMDRSGKCSVARVMTEKHPGLTLERFKELHLEELHATYQYWNFSSGYDKPIITEIPGDFATIEYP